MQHTERTVSSICGSVALDGFIVQRTVRDSMRRCLNDETIFDFAVVYVAGARAGYRTFHRTACDSDDPYCYENSCILMNRLNLRDEVVLMTKIRDVTALRIAETERYPILKEPGTELLSELHRQIYGDIFSWAGEFRITETDDPRFCRSIHIKEMCDGLMGELKAENFLSDYTKEKFCERLAHYICELHVIMPFRFGTDLTVRTFANFIAQMNGYYLDYSLTCASLMDIALRRSFSDESEMHQIVLSVVTEYD